MAGIYRSVWLYSTGPVWFEDLAVNGDFDFRNGDGSLTSPLISAFRSRSGRRSADRRRIIRSGHACWIATAKKLQTGRMLWIRAFAFPATA